MTQLPPVYMLETDHVYFCPNGTKGAFPPYLSVVEVPDIYSTWDTLMQLPGSKSVRPLRPPGYPEQAWLDFERHIMTANEARLSLISTTRNQFVPWVFNTIDNLAFSDFKERAQPVSEGPKPSSPHKYVWIVGNGPSLESALDLYQPGDAIWIAYHALPRLTPLGLTPQLVAHVDALIPPDFWVNDPTDPVANQKNTEHIAYKLPNISADSLLLVAPYSNSTFIQSYPNNKLLVYGGVDFFLNSFVNVKLGFADLLPICGTVVHAMITTAVLNNWKKIVLAGVDLGSLDPEDPDFRGSRDRGLREVTNQHGNKIITDHILTAYVDGLEYLPNIYKHLNIKFFNASKIGQDIKGYVPFSRPKKSP